MPHKVNQWNYTDRGSQSVYNDSYRGVQGAQYQASSMRSNQGFASAVATFPQGSFMTCRYPATPEMQRTAATNTWHPEFVSATSGTPSVEANLAASLGHNTTGTRPLPVPHSQRPGYAEEEAAEAARKRAAYLAFQARQISTVGGDVIPADFHEHTIHSEEHIRTQLKPGQIFRPSKPRVGTTPAERADAARMLAEQQALAVAQAAAHDEQQQQQQLAATRRRAEGRADEGASSFYPAAMDSTRPARTGGLQPEYYNVPQPRTHPSQF